MSIETIYAKLRSAGMTKAGACGLMGNWYCESLMKSDNVEDRCPLSDTAYTKQVDSGAMGRQKFSSDAYGYGLAQWTSPDRKGQMYDYIKGRGLSIADENAQVEFSLREFPSQAPATLDLLKSSDDVYKCTEWVCKYYERPAVNNVAARYAKAMEYFNRLPADIGNIVIEPSNEAVEQAVEAVEIFWPPRVIARGMKGDDVSVLQAILNARGYPCGVVDGVFGAATAAALTVFQLNEGITADAIAGTETWARLLRR